MASAKEFSYTIDDIYALPDGERAELIDGQLYMIATPKRIHQKILAKLSSLIDQYITSHNGSCKVYPAPFAVFLNADEHTYVEPDISVICNKSKLDDRGCSGAPDWVLKIVFPSTQHLDYGVKLFLYRSAGVREYWIVNPATQTVNVYNFEPDGQISQHSFDALYRHYDQEHQLPAFPFHCRHHRYKSIYPYHADCYPCNCPFSLRMCKFDRNWKKLHHLYLFTAYNAQTIIGKFNIRVVIHIFFQLKNCRKGTSRNDFLTSCKTHNNPSVHIRILHNNIFFSPLL